jgi:hypothetical protein
MKVGLAIYNLLYNNTAVRTLTQGKIYPELAKEGQSMPYIVYSVVSNSPSDTKDGTPIDEAQCEIFSVGSTYEMCNNLADKVRAALDRKGVTVTDASAGDITVQSIQYTNEITEVSADRKTYIAVQDYTFRIKR